MFVSGINGNIFQQGIFNTKYIYFYYFKIAKAIRFGKFLANILQIVFLYPPFRTGVILVLTQSAQNQPIKPVV